jgi:DinB superfamily
MTHPLVEQLRFARAEWRRGLRGVSEEDGFKRLMPMNSIGWIVAHLSWQEQRYWLTRMVGETPRPIVNELAAYGAPATTPSLKEMLAAWKVITTTADPHLDALTEADMATTLRGQPPRRLGDALLRVTYHYWFHTGEILAIRQLLDHPNRPEFVGNIDGRAPYRPPA